MKKTFVAALLGATLLTGSAVAAQPSPQDRPMGDPMARADTNGDGIVTREEALAEAAQRFARMDANRDGKISKDERPEPTGSQGGRFGGRMLERMDTNGDGVITLDEQRAQASQRFDRLDANHDGKLDKAEIDAARARMGRMSGGRGPGGDAPRPLRPTETKAAGTSPGPSPSSSARALPSAAGVVTVASCPKSPTSSLSTTNARSASRSHNT
ncbi:EF-hand domain-containing protein [Sphingomonas sp. MMS12-HWE2-04]|uniref:EF-hand domain-containing protein n=1 Tax=Sphingomonas sp. MMS12-HWE2-04 TaxID=3234199 RepID=UPI00384F55F0